MIMMQIKMKRVDILVWQERKGPPLQKAPSFTALRDSYWLKS